MYNISRSIIWETLKQYPEIKPYLSEKTFKVIGGVLPIVERYYNIVYNSVKGYLSGTKYTTSYRNNMAVAMGESFTDVVYLGFQEAGGELPLDQETASWLAKRIGEERQHIDDLFERLKLERPVVSEDDIEKEATSRAQGYSNTLDTMYQEAKMRGSKNKTLIFTGRPGKDSCPECQKLEGKRHRISWILANNMIPRPGNTNFTCEGYGCHHYWMDPITGEAYSL